MSRDMRLAVVGHVEWVEFARVERLPEPGDIVGATDSFAEPAGGGGVAAVQLARLAGACTLFTALGDDELGHRAHDRLAELGVRVESAWRPEPQRKAFTLLDGSGERTITVIGEKLVPRGSDDLPWSELASADGAFFVAGDPAALGCARGAHVLSATPRELSTLAETGIAFDAVVGSGLDPAERCEPGDLDPEPALLVATEGEEGGHYRLADEGERRYEAVEPPGPIVDTYGAGDSFAAALTYALAGGDGHEAALALAARAGAACVAGRGPYSGQLRAEGL